MKLVTTALALATLVGLGLWFWSGDGNTAPVPPHKAQQPPLAAGPEPAPSETPVSTVTPVITAPFSEPPSKPEVETERETLGEPEVIGRFLKEGSGLPVVGASLRLTYRGARATNNPRSTVQQAPITTEGSTDQAGRFRLVRPASSFGVWTLSFRHPEHGFGYCRFDLPEGHSEFDLGDLRVPTPVTLRGRVEDTAGLPQGRVSIQLRSSEKEDPTPGAFLAPQSHETKTRPDGTFEFSTPVAARKFSVRVASRILQSSQEIDLTGIVGESSQLIVVEPRSPGTMISGVVVDEHDRPIRFASIDVSGSREPLESDEAGWFEFLASEPSDTPEAQVFVQAPGYASDTIMTRWGTLDLVVRLETLPTVEILVVDGKTGEPVENYTVCPLRISPSDAVLGESVVSTRHCPAGQTQISVPRGRGALAVIPTEPWAPSAVHHFQGTTDAPAQLRIPVFQHEGVVRVVTTDRTPVAGSLVTALVPVDGTTPVQRTIRGLGERSSSSSVSAYRYGEARTDADGFARLPLPPDQAFTLWVNGDLHPPVLETSVNASVHPHEITVQLGASLKGTIGPMQLLEHIQRKDGPWTPPSIPALRLAPKNSATPVFDAPHSAIDQNGEFLFVGVPAGDWILQIAATLDFVTTQWDIATIDGLAPGEVRTLTIDATPLVPGSINLRVTVDGQALGDQETVQLAGHALHGGEQVFHRHPKLFRPDMEGRIRGQLRAGTYHVYLGNVDDGGCKSQRSIVVAPGETTAVDVNIESATLRISVVASDGKTQVPNARVFWQPIGPESRLTGAVTDAQGRIEHPRLRPGLQKLFILPKHYDGDDYPKTLVEQNIPLRDAVIPCGSVEVVSGAGSFDTIVLPPASGY